MSKRDPVTAATVAAVAAQNAGHPLDPERASRYAQALEPILQMVASLRELPLKDVEPACIFRPEQADRND
ncbi:MAG: hypothetical protein ACU85U_17555 [Gammaproteobacteria bacterium]|jgi:Asp-tRNA(Asn)/Glu-tRNA(Gln) amidotransferase C subunit